MEINYVGVHHFGPPNPNLTLRELNNAHKSRWPDFPSELRPDLFVGYNIIIWRDGTWLQCRFLGEETAAQKGHNYDTVSICLEGNFSNGVKPYAPQLDTLKRLVVAIVGGKATELGLKVKSGTSLHIKRSNVLPHRVLQPNHTECYGNSLTNDWAVLLCFPPEVIPPITTPLPPQTNGVEIGRIRAMIEILLKILKIQEMIEKMKLGSVDKYCWHDARG